MKPADREGVSMAVVEFVADFEGVSPTDLPPLNEFVSPDALDALFRNREQAGTVTFDYAGYLVQVDEDNQIEIEESS